MITLENETATRELGKKIGASLNGHEVIELVGDVGAGKTTLVKGIAEGLGISDRIQSPSFTINRVYEAPNNITLAHYDFYRLHDAGIMIDEIREAINDQHTVVVVEWSETVKDVLPDDRMIITISPASETSRNIAIQGGAPL